MWLRPKMWKKVSQIFPYAADHPGRLFTLQDDMSAEEVICTKNPCKWHHEVYAIKIGISTKCIIKTIFTHKNFVCSALRYEGKACKLTFDLVYYNYWLALKIFPFSPLFQFTKETVTAN